MIYSRLPDNYRTLAIVTDISPDGETLLDFDGLPEKAEVFALYLPTTSDRDNTRKGQQYLMNNTPSAACLTLVIAQQRIIHELPLSALSGSQEHIRLFPVEWTHTANVENESRVLWTENDVHETTIMKLIVFYTLPTKC